MGREGVPVVLALSHASREVWSPSWLRGVGGGVEGGTCGAGTLSLGVLHKFEVWYLQN